jgi:hypothetical protein
MLDANMLIHLHNSDCEQHEASWTWMEAALGAEELIGIPWHSFLAFPRIIYGLVNRKMQGIADRTSAVTAWKTSLCNRTWRELSGA